MTSIVVDAEEATGTPEVPEATIEPTTNDAVDTIEAADEVTTSTEAENIVPDKFAGKSLEDVISSYENLEKELGRKSQEIGELRKLSDSFLQAEMVRNQQTNLQDNQAKPEKETLDEYDFFADPDKAVNQAIENHPRFQEFQRFQQQATQQATRSKLEQSHPDFGDIIKDEKFLNWVDGSPIRKQLFQAADAYNFDAANELLSTWKDRSMIDKTQEVKQAAEAERQAALKAGATESRSSSGSAGGKTYRRADLIRLKIQDPTKYESMQDEIFAAYSEGRVK